jgi:hypothetical protein
MAESIQNLAENLLSDSSLKVASNMLNLMLARF